VAVAHSILVSAYDVPAEGRPYEELGGDYFLRREDHERITQRLVPSSNGSDSALRWNPWRNQRG
jgi:transposase